MTIYNGYINAGSLFSSKIKEDNILEYHLNCKDLKGRTCIQIMAENRLYEILNDDNIGAIIGKYWGGDTMVYGLSDISSFTYLTRYNLFDEVITFTNFSSKYNTDRHFYFNYYSFRNIVSRRYFFKELYNIFLVACYQILIYLAVTDGDLQRTVDGSYGLLQYITFYGSLTLLLNKINSIIFFSFVNRWYIEIDNHLFEILFLCSLLVHFLDLKNWFLVDDGQSHELMSAILLSHQISFLWWRVIDSLKATKLYGGFLRTVFVTISKLFLFLIFFYCFIIMITGIFNLLFQQYTQFATYYATFFYLVQAALQSYDFLPMWSKYLKFSLLGFMIICTVILMNLIIALTTKIYDDVDENIQSEHRSNLIKIYEYLRFDENYGIFKFLSAPFNVIQIPFSLIVLFSENKSYWNELSCSICFILIALFYFIVFLIYNTIKFPFSLLYQIFINSSRYDTTLTRIFVWVFLGWFFCLYYYVMDLVCFWYYAYRKQVSAEVKDNTENQNILEMRKLYATLIKDIAEIVECDKKSTKFSVGDLLASWFKKAGTKSSNLVENRIHKKSIVTSKYSERKSSPNNSFVMRSSHATLIKNLCSKVSILEHFKKGLAFIQKFCDRDG
jgi:hypothetical protein